MDVMKKVSDAFKGGWKFSLASTAVIIGIGQVWARFVPHGSATVGPVEFLYSTAPVQVNVGAQATNPAVANTAALQFGVSKVLSVFGGGTQVGIPEFAMAAAAAFLTIMSAILVWNFFSLGWAKSVFKKLMAVFVLASVIGTVLAAVVVGGFGQVMQAFSIGLLLAFIVTGILVSFIMTKVIEWDLLGLGIKTPSVKN